MYDLQPPVWLQPGSLRNLSTTHWWNIEPRWSLGQLLMKVTDYPQRAPGHCSVWTAAAPWPCGFSFNGYFKDQEKFTGEETPQNDQGSSVFSAQSILLCQFYVMLFDFYLLKHFLKNSCGYITVVMLVFGATGIVIMSLVSGMMLPICSSPRRWKSKQNRFIAKYK